MSCCVSPEKCLSILLSENHLNRVRDLADICHAKQLALQNRDFLAHQNRDILNPNC